MSGAYGIPSAVSGDQSSASFWQDPAGYALFHQSAPSLPSPILGMSQADIDYFQQNIYPMQQQLLSQALNPNTVKQNVAQAEQDVSNQYAKLPGEYQQLLASQGVVATQAQKADFNKQSALNAGIATAAAANQARAATGAQVAGILRGG